MTRTEIVRDVEDAIRKLNYPLSEKDKGFGWTDSRRQDILRYFEKLQEDLNSGRDIPFFSLIRALDGMGISEGDLLEELCQINNAVNRLQTRTGTPANQ